MDGEQKDKMEYNMKDQNKNDTPGNVIQNNQNNDTPFDDSNGNKMKVYPPDKVSNSDDHLVENSSRKGSEKKLGKAFKSLELKAQQENMTYDAEPESSNHQNDQRPSSSEQIMPKKVKGAEQNAASKEVDEPTITKQQTHEQTKEERIRQMSIISFQPNEQQRQKLGSTGEIIDKEMMQGLQQIRKESQLSKLANEQRQQTQVDQENQDNKQVEQAAVNQNVFTNYKFTKQDSVPKEIQSKKQLASSNMSKDKTTKMVESSDQIKDIHKPTFEMKYEKSTAPKEKEPEEKEPAHNQTKFDPRSKTAMKREFQDIVLQLWGQYDEDDTGQIDKIEAQNFVNEVIQAWGNKPIVVQSFNSYFDQVDTIKEGSITKKQMIELLSFIDEDREYNESDVADGKGYIEGQGSSLI